MSRKLCNTRLIIFQSFLHDKHILADCTIGFFFRTAKMNTIKCFTVTMIIALGLFPYKNNAELPIDRTTSSEDIQYKTSLDEIANRLLLVNVSNDKYVSPLHDIPLNTNRDGVYRAVIVMPKGSNEGKTISMDRDMNPIVSVRNPNRNSPIIQWNYGALTQTWENESVVDPRTNKLGDNGQLDVIVLGQRTYDCGAVVNVKIVGALPMIITESDRTNWQLIAIDANDSNAATVNSVEDVDKEYPGYFELIKQWLAAFNVPPGGRDNHFLDTVDAPAAVQLVFEKHNLWKGQQELPGMNSAPGISLYNFTLGNQWTTGVLLFPVPR